MEVRTGKTFCALATCQKFGAKSVNIITKKKAIPSIEADYNEMQPGFTVQVLNFESVVKYEKRPKAETIDEEKKKVKRKWKCNFKNARPDIWVIDEADSLGQFPKPSERTQILQEMLSGSVILYLSGTPHPETPSQLYHQFSVSSFSPWREYKSFYAWAKAGYVNVAKQFINNKEFNEYSDADGERITKETGHLFFTYSQEEAGFKQAVQEQRHFVTMQSSTYRLANIILKDRIYIGKNGDVILADQASKVQQKLHQIYSGTVKLEPNRIELPDGGHTFEKARSIIFDRSKVKYIQENFAGKKLAIFYKFVAEGEMLKEAFADSWTDVPEVFNSTDNITFICQISSGKQGTNLSSADYQIMFNPDFSANSYWQGRARMVTKDRQAPVIVIWLMSVGGIEEKVYDAVMDKKDYTLQYFKKDFMPWLKNEKVILTRIQQIKEIERAEAKANGNQLELSLPVPQQTAVGKDIVINNVFEDPFK